MRPPGLLTAILVAILAIPSPAAARGFTIDFEALKRRCPWCDESSLKLVWSFFFVTKTELFLVSMQGRMTDREGRAISVVYLRRLRLDDGLVHEAAAVLSPSSFLVGDDGTALRIGSSYSRISRLDTQMTFDVHVLIPEGATELDAQIRCDVPSPLTHGVPLVEQDTPRAYLEYDVLCARGTFSGTYRQDGSSQAISGLSLVEGIRWPALRIPEPLTWHWGFLHSGPYTFLFFTPFDFRGREVFWLWSDGACLDCAIGPVVRLPSPGGGRGGLVIERDTKGGLVRLSVQPARWSGASSEMSLAPYELRIQTKDGERYVGSGSMVLELGRWDSF